MSSSRSSRAAAGTYSAASTSPSAAQQGVRVQAHHVRHAFTRQSDVVKALWDFDLTIDSGEFVSIVGPSGCGKTTFLAMVGGLLRPRYGEVTLDGNRITGPDQAVAYMLARDALLPWRTARQNVELGLEAHGTGKHERRSISEQWLARVNLSDFANSYPSELSQGMRQRVAIARTLAMEPRCLLMDEPFAALDAQTRTFLQQEFLVLWANIGSTVIFITHDLGEAILLGDRVILMSHRPGRVLADLRIEIPRPRPPRIEFDDPAFRAYHKSLSDLLDEEVKSQFADRM